MAMDDSFDAFALEIGARERARIEEHFFDVVREDGAIPPAKMKEFVTAHPQALQVEGRESVIDLGDPLRHAVIISVFGLEGELQIGAVYGLGNGVVLSQAAVRAQAG